MINVNYQAYGNGFNLRLRLYQDGETKFVSVNKLLQGSLSKKHWNQKKQCFIQSAPFSSENNRVLADFKYLYEQKAMEWDGSLQSFVNSFAIDKKTEQESKPTMDKLLEIIIAEFKQRRHADSTVKGTYESYEKLKNRLVDFCEYKNLKYENLLIEDFTSQFINSIFEWINVKRGGKGMVYISKTLHSTLNKADAYGLYNFAKLRGVRWARKSTASAHKYNTLTPEQCNRFLAMKRSDMPQNQLSQLYHDFCTFLLFTGQSPCDAIALRYSDIQVIDGVKHLVFLRRKISEKQSVPCAVPVNKIMSDIMDRWKKVAKDEYIFPIRNKQKLSNQIVNNGDIKHFIGRLNHWLKYIGKALGCTFPLHSYTFRHTAITNYVSKGVPIIYIANMMGTSVANCEKIYYNNRGDASSRNMVLNVTSF